ncbi:MAG: DUF6444 domain-containing protein [Caldilineaceae bacterium]
MKQGEILERSQLEQLAKSALIRSDFGAASIQLVEQGKQIQKLSDQIAKHSQNSSKPPGSDGLKKPRTQSLRSKGETEWRTTRAPGDTLQMVLEPGEIIEHSVPSCPHCQADLCQVEAMGYDKRQVFDIPLVQFEVTEHRVAIKSVPWLRGQSARTFPDAIRHPTQYSPHIKPKPAI